MKVAPGQETFLVIFSNKLSKLNKDKYNFIHFSQPFTKILNAKEGGDQDSSFKPQSQEECPSR